MSAQRIVSFLPSATEMVCALGLEDRLVGITHECDYPPSIQGRPVVVRSALPIETMTQAEIDTAVSKRLAEGQSLYEVDEKLLRDLAPDVILTQDLCQVCAPSGNEITQALNALPKKPEILWLTPKSLRQIEENLHDIAQAADCVDKADRLIAATRASLDAIAAKTRNLVRQRVFCMEWIDPVYCSGHWVPEMVNIAGGIDELSRLGTDSVRISWNEVMEWAPEVLVIMPCGCHVDKTVELAPQAYKQPGWFDLPAVRKNQVYAVDASSYFARPGPRVLEGTKLLAHLIHPEVFPWEGPDTAYRRLEAATMEQSALRTA